MRGKLSVAFIVSLLMAATIACAGQGTTNASAPGTVTVTVIVTVPTPPTTQQSVPTTAVRQPIIEMVGKCNDPGGMRLVGHNFAENGAYQEVASYPNNDPYPLINGGRGRANAAGELSAPWNCKEGANGQHDPPGKGYRMMVMDLTSGLKAEIVFEVSY